MGEGPQKNLFRVAARGAQGFGQKTTFITNFYVDQLKKSRYSIKPFTY